MVAWYYRDLGTAGGYWDFSTTNTANTDATTCPGFFACPHALVTAGDCLTVSTVASNVTATWYASNGTTDIWQVVGPGVGHWLGWQQNQAMGLGDGVLGAARRERDDAARQAAAREQVERRALRASAEARAEALLLRHLSPEQAQQYRHFGWFDVEVGGRLYRIEGGFAGNVTQRDPRTRRSVRRYCAHIDMRLPVQDNLLAQLFRLVNDEGGFLAVANVS